jgi:hypothetical protein
MALATYSDLQASVADWLNRDDLTAQIPDFIAMAEARFNREIRNHAMIGRYTNTTSNSYFSLPADWVEMISLVSTGSPPVALEYVSIDSLNDIRQDVLTGNPRYYTIIDNDLLVHPSQSDDVDFELTYYKKIAALSDVNTSNWLLSSHPDIYLYGSLMQAEPYLKNDERTTTWATLLSQAMEALRLADERAKRPAGGFTARRRTFG